MAVSTLRRRGGVLLAAFTAIGLAASAATSQESPPTTQPAAQETLPTTAPITTSPTDLPGADGASLPAVTSVSPLMGPAWWERLQTPTDFWPSFTWSTLAWLGAVIILALMFRPKPLLSLRNLDALVLSLMCLLLALRDAGTDPNPRPLAYAGLTVAAVYWLLRGVWLVLAKQPPRDQPLAATGPLCVLLFAGLALCVQQIATSPLSPGARDALVGGLCTAQTGKLPYGDATPHDRRSPLLYLLHAGAVRVIEPSMPGDNGAGAMPLAWANREQWLHGDWWEQADVVPARLVNALLFLGTLAGIYVIGRRLQSVALSWTLAAIFCVFPGTIECLPRPEVMLPTLLLTWTIAFALLPYAGGLLASICLVLAGLAWPWAWLGLPVLIAHFARRRWQTAGCIAGVFVGAAACVYVVAAFAQPALPRAAGALAMAGIAPAFDASLGADGTIAINRRAPGVAHRGPAPLTGRVWKLLVEAEDTLVGPNPNIDWPNSVAGNEKQYRQIQAVGEALPLLQDNYRRTVAELPKGRRFAVALRSLLEATWTPAEDAPASHAGAWELWGGPPPQAKACVLSRRIAKGAIVALVIWATLATYLRRRTQPWHLAGALLIVVSGGLLASETGAVSGLAWLLPAVLAAWAAYEVAPAPEPPPRVTVER